MPSPGSALYFLLKLSVTLFFLLQKQYMHIREKVEEKGKMKADIISPDSSTVNVSQCVLCKIKNEVILCISFCIQPFLFINIQWSFFPVKSILLHHFYWLHRILQFNQFFMVQHFTLLSKWGLLQMHILADKSFCLSLIISLVQVCKTGFTWSNSINVLWLWVYIVKLISRNLKLLYVLVLVCMYENIHYSDFCNEEKNLAYLRR